MFLFEELTRLNRFTFGMYILYRQQYGFLVEENLVVYAGKLDKAEASSSVHPNSLAPCNLHRFLQAFITFCVDEVQCSHFLTPTKEEIKTQTKQLGGKINMSIHAIIHRIPDLKRMITTIVLIMKANKRYQKATMTTIWLTSIFPVNHRILTFIWMNNK